MGRMLDPETLLAERAWLRGLARCLVGASDADDLCQDTMVAALVAQPQARGGLRPWLATVARRLAALGARRRARRLRREEAAARHEATASAEEEVGRAELHRAVVEAVLALQEPYRSSVLLRFFDGLPVREVARRCGVPPETARTRLKRGLSLLRSRLDRALGGREAWAGGLWPAGLGRAGPSWGAPAMGLAGTWVTVMQSKVLAGAGLVAVAVAAWVLWSAAPGPSAGQDGTGRADPTAARAPHAPEGRPVERAGVAERALPPAEEERRALLEEPPGAPVTEGAGVALAITGRCLLEDGQPLPGVQVEVRDLFADRTEAPRAAAGARTLETSGWDDRSRVRTTTGADGSFFVSMPLSERSQLQVRIAREGLTTRDANLGAPRRFLPVLDLGDVRLYGAFELAGTLVDQEGLPLSGVRLVLERGGPTEEILTPGGVLLAGAVSGDDGSFSFGRPLRAGTWHVTAVTGKGVVSWQPRSLTGTPGGRAEIVLAATTRSAISGVVLYPDGTPVARATVHARDPATGAAFAPSGMWTPASTDDQGRFTLFPTGAEGDAVLVHCVPGKDFVTEPVEARWGDQGVRITVQRRPEVSLMVVEEGTQRPVLRYAYCVATERERYVPRDTVRTTDGRTRLRGLSPGTNWLYVVPEDPGLAPAGPIEVSAAAGRAASLTVRVSAPRRLAVRVLDSAGRPMEGAEVLLVSTAGDGRLTNTEPLRDGRRTGLFVGPFHQWDRAQTEGSGRALLSVPRLDGWRHHVVARAEGGVEAAAEVGGEDEVVLVVSRGGTIRGRIEGLPEGVTVFARREEGHVVRIPARGGVPAGKDGTFLIALVPAGRWSVGVEDGARQEVVLGGVEVGGPGPGLLELDARGRLAGGHEVRVFRGGELVEIGELRVFAVAGGGMRRVRTYAVRDGVCRLPVLAAREYELVLAVWEGEEALRVDPGSDGGFPDVLWFR